MTDFPTTPANGDTHVIATSTWEYYASTDRWEIKDTSGSAYYVDTVIDTLTWSAGTTSVTSVPIVYSDYITVTVTYTAVTGDTAVTEFQMSKSAGNYIVVNFPHGTGVISGTPMWGLLPMGGTTAITTATGTASNDVTINTVFNTSSHTNVIGADHSTLTFGWSVGAFAAGGSIVITGRALIIDPNSIGALSDVNSTVATDGQVLTWDNTNSYWKPDDSGGGSNLAIGTVPAAPAIGNMWFDNATTGFLYTWDGNSWIQLTGLGGGNSGAGGGLGTGTQSWGTYVNEHPTSPMTPLRANNTNYQNTSGQPIFVSVTSYATVVNGSIINNEGFLFVSPSSTEPSGSPTGDGNVRYDGPSTGWVLTGKGSGHSNEYDTDNATAIVPDQCWYRHTGAVPIVWTELRG